MRESRSGAFFLVQIAETPKRGNGALSSPPPLFAIILYTLTGRGESAELYRYIGIHRNGNEPHAEKSPAPSLPAVGGARGRGRGEATETEDNARARQRENGAGS